MWCYTDMNRSYLFWENIVNSRKNVSHEGAVLDVFVVTDDVDGVIARLGGPVAHVTGAVALVIALDFSLRRAFDGEAWGNLTFRGRKKPG